MKRFMTTALALTACICCFAGRPIRVGSYNLRMENLDKGENSWENRRDKVARSIADNRFDIFGVEEVTEKVQAELPVMTGGIYDCVFFSPYSQDGVGGKAHGILFRKDRFKLLEVHRFWMSENPDSCSYNDFWFNKAAGKTSKFKRGGMCGIFEDLKNPGQKIFFMASHAALSAEDNFKYAHVFVDMEKRFNPEGLPSFFVGDLNTRPDSPTSEYLRTYWTDASSVAKEAGCTFNAFNPDMDRKDPRRIDFIYCRGNVKIRKYFCNYKLYDGRCASDHYPIWADVKIK